MTDLPQPAPDCAACAARDVVIAGQAETIAAQAGAIEELRQKVERLEGEQAGGVRGHEGDDELDGDGWETADVKVAVVLVHILNCPDRCVIGLSR